MSALQAGLRTGLPGPLAAVRGRLITGAPVGRQTWFGAGGRAEMLFWPADVDDLADGLAALPPEAAVTVVGGGANLLIRDGGIPGITVRLGRAFAGVAIDGTDIIAGAGALHLNVALAAAESGIAGLEFLSGIPGTLGGGLRMNAGAYGGAIADLLVQVTAIDRSGALQVIDAAQMGFSYRHCAIDPDWIFVAARLRGTLSAASAIADRMGEIRRTREATQPIRARTGGSTFTNPPGNSAWRLIDAAGCRGLTRGAAMVSSRHPNFLVNSGNASAADLEELGEEVRRRVGETSGISLEWEIRRIGRRRAGLAPLGGEGSWQ
jgi:UDP-N-acetylmuramate dehydrogenase